VEEDDEEEDVADVMLPSVWVLDVNGLVTTELLLESLPAVVVVLSLDVVERVVPDVVAHPPPTVAIAPRPHRASAAPRDKTEGKVISAHDDTLSDTH
jgi:hypothetical protein